MERWRNPGVLPRVERKKAPHTRCAPLPKRTPACRSGVGVATRSHGVSNNDPHPRRHSASKTHVNALMAPTSLQGGGQERVARGFATCDCRDRCSADSIHGKDALALEARTMLRANTVD